jgi:hypothetical protein
MSPPPRFPSGHISIPLDFLLFLYPPMHMCSGDCLNDRNGIKTFRSNEGSYGWPKAGEVRNKSAN